MLNTKVSRIMYKVNMHNIRVGLNTVGVLGGGRRHVVDREDVLRHKPKGKGGLKFEQRRWGLETKRPLRCHVAFRSFYRNVSDVFVGVQWCCTVFDYKTPTLKHVINSMERLR